MSHTSNYVSSRQKLLSIVEGFLAQHPEISDTQFGYKAVADTRTVGRLRDGGDITTAKMDAILAFISTYKNKDIK